MRSLIEIAAKFAAKNHPKVELNYVYIDGTNIVARDAISLLVIPHGQNIDTPLLVEAAGAVKKGYNCDQLFHGYPAVSGKSYPPYQLIIPSPDRAILYTSPCLLEAVQLYPFFLNEKKCYIDVSLHLPKLKALAKETQSVTLLQSDEGAPIRFNITLKSGEEAVLVIMPYVV